MPGTHAEMIQRLRAERARLVERIAQVDAAIAALEPLAAGEQLSKGERSVNVAGMATMQPEARLRRSRAVIAKHGDPCAVAANAKGLCMSDVARAVGVSPAYLSMVRNGKRTITQETADKIERLIGFKATKANWPRLTAE